MTSTELSGLHELRALRPHRADAARNYDKLLDAAREVFTEHDVDAPLDEVARRAGVGIATLYRNFPTREQLLDNVYLHEIEAVCAAAPELAALGPWDGLVAWLHRFLDYIPTKRAVIAGINRDSEIYRACTRALYEAGGPLLRAAQGAGLAREDVDIDDVLRYMIGSAVVNFASAEQQHRMLDVLFDGLRPPPRGGEAATSAL